MRWRKGKQRELDLGSLTQRDDALPGSITMNEISVPDGPLSIDRNKIFFNIEGAPATVMKLPLPKIDENLFKVAQRDLNTEDPAFSWNTFIQEYVAAYRKLMEKTCHHDMELIATFKESFTRGSVYRFRCKKCMKWQDIAKSAFWR